LVSELDKMAFESLRDGNEEIYTMNASGSDQRNLTVDSASDSHPDWQPTSWR
jgi:TolB protein